MHPLILPKALSGFSFALSPNGGEGQGEGESYLSSPPPNYQDSVGVKGLIIIIGYLTAGVSRRGTGEIPRPAQKLSGKYAPGRNSAVNAFALHRFGETTAWLYGKIQQKAAACQ